MKNFKQYLAFIFLALLAFMSCTKVINDVVKPGDKPIINAYLAPSQPVSMKVYTEIPYTSSDSAYSKPITGLNIKITSSNGKTYTLKGDGEGNYSSNSNELIGPAGTSVSMSFNYNGRTVAATTVIPSKPLNFTMDNKSISRVARDLSAIGQGGGGGGFGGPGFVQETRVTINLNWNNPDNVYHFVAAQSLEANPVPVIILPTSGNFANRPPFRFNNQPIQATSSSLQSQSFEYFGKYAIILYKLNSDYAALYLNNSTTSQNISTPVGTITNGLGIFTGVNADTLILNVLKAN